MTNPQVSADHGYLSHRQILIVLAGLLAGMFLAALDMSIVGTALPRIVSDLGGLNHLSWVVTAYLLTSTSSTPLWGKISDLYGRRPMFQTAITVFVAGSVLSALAQSMPMLIGGRAIQGIGAGGLMALALSIVGDVIPPRERGRYQGYFGAVFGFSSVSGPLVGGWFTDGPGWEWIFWINVPIGIAALIATTIALRSMPRIRRDHKIDYLGAAVIVASVTAILLYTAWAGNEYGWTDPFSLALLVGGVILAALFAWVESRAEEPIIPLRLFRNRVFSPTVAFTALLGIAMFGGIIFLPVYFQVVQGMTPTESGLALVPMMAGILLTSIGSGRLMTRTGHYKVFPIIGAGVVTVAYALLRTLGADTPYWRVGLFIFVLGAGLGFTMQTVVTAVQNAVDRRDMGAATSSVAFFRTMGGAFGTAIFGAVLTSRLGHYLGEAGGALPSGSGEADIANNVQAIQSLPPQIHDTVVTAWVNAVQDVFLVALPFTIIALVLAFLIPELELKQADKPATERVLAE
ncbi:MAG TPA: MDR family MFS transporter [Jiangellaceae bacterium]